MEKILITGTSSGIGNFLAQKLKNNHEIFGISRSKNNIDNITFFQGDINDFLFLEKIKNQIIEIDYLILNAGVGYFDNFENISIKNHKEIIETNLLSPIILTHLLINKIKKGIIFIGSISSKKSGKYGATYSASKFGLRGFAMNLKNETKGKKIFIINPKVVKTNFHNKSNIEIQGKFTETNINDILISIEEIINGIEKRFEIDL